jgi:CRISPR system Cascade subunit CasE
MYFSVITPSPGRERDAAQQRATGPYAEHQWLWHFFPAEAGSPRDFLFRRMDIDGMPRFYLVSKRPPQTPYGGAWGVQSREYAPSLAVGRVLHFDLRANPVITVSAEGKSTRHDVVMHEKKRLLAERGLVHWQELKAQDKPALYELVSDVCGQWLRSRSARLGFEIAEEDLLVGGYAQHSEKKGSLRFSTVDFSGVLKVTDSTAFSNMLLSGVGRAKAFGCGLLLVRKT